MSSSSRNSCGRRAVQWAVAAAMAGGSVSVPAASEWAFDPRVEVAAVYDDNYRLTDQPGTEIEVTGGALDAALGMRSQGQRSELGLTPRLHSTFFPNASSEEATEYYLDALAQTRTQRLVSAFKASYANESVVSSELLAADFPGLNLGQTVSGDTGRVSVRNRRRLIVANPSLAWDWTERRHLTAGLQYADARFDKSVFEQISYKDYSGSAGVVWDVTRRHTFSLNVTGDRYTPDTSDNATNTEGLLGEWRSAVSEVSTWYVRVGAQHSQRDASPNSPKISATAFNGGVGAAWQFQTTRMVFDLLRATTPSAVGTVVNRDEVRFRVTRDFQPRLSGFLALRGIHTDGLHHDTVTTQSRSYATGTTGFEWRMNRQYTLRGAYDYTWQKFQAEAHNAVSNGVSVSVIYEPRRLR